MRTHLLKHATATAAPSISMSYPILQGEGSNSWSNKKLIVAHDLIDRLSEKLGLPLTALGSLTGAQLAGCQYRHPLFARTSPVVIGGDYITTESGTGLVHTAPGHGQEDYQVRLILPSALAWQHVTHNQSIMLLIPCH